jgi:hypothetical protein
VPTSPFIGAAARKHAALREIQRHVGRKVAEAPARNARRERQTWPMPPPRLAIPPVAPKPR